MILSIISGVIVVLLLVAFLAPRKFTHTVNEFLTETKIIEKFNKICKQIGKKNPEWIKRQLFECLDQYKKVKTEELSFNLSQVRIAISDIKKEIETMRGLSEKQTYQIRNLKRDNPKQAAHLLYKKEQMENAIKQLQEARIKMDGQEAAITSSIDEFNTKLALKRAEVCSRITSVTIGGCDINFDLNMSDLFDKFDHVTIAEEAKAEVVNKVYHLESQDAVPYNEEEYLKKLETV